MTDDAPETRAQRVWRLQVEGRCRDIGQTLTNAVLPGTGFALFLFDLGAGGAMAYVSSAVRADMRRAVLEWVELTATHDDVGELHQLVADVQARLTRERTHHG